MNQSMLGIIDATAQKEEIQDLTSNRSLAAVPIGGRYRLIDFVLSNMVNSGIQSVAIFPRYQYRSLMDHLGSGKEWDLNRKRDGLFFFPSSEKELLNGVGSFHQFRSNIDFFLRSKQKYVLITNSHTVCNIDYKKILERHLENQCDITQVNQKGKMLDMFILEKDLLIKLFSNKDSGYRNIMDVVKDHNHNLTVCDYENNGYVAVVDSISNYYSHSLSLLNPNIWKELFLRNRPIYTKVKDEAPTKYSKDAYVKNSLIANGAIIEGHVENCIVFRGVKIEKGTVVKNSIIMQKSVIKENSVLDNVILDKDVRVEPKTILIGKVAEPLVLKKGTVQGALMNS